MLAHRTEGKKTCPPRTPRLREVCPGRLAMLERLLQRAAVHGEQLAAVRARHAGRLHEHEGTPYVVLLGAERRLTFEEAEDLQWAILECLALLTPDNDEGRMRAVDVSEAILRVLGEVWIDP